MQQSSKWKIFNLSFGWKEDNKKPITVFFHGNHLGECNVSRSRKIDPKSNDHRMIELTSPHLVFM